MIIISNWLRTSRFKHTFITAWFYGNLDFPWELQYRSWRDRRNFRRWKIPRNMYLEGWAGSCPLSIELILSDFEPIPEPETWLMFLLGGVMASVFLYRKSAVGSKLK